MILSNVVSNETAARGRESQDTELRTKICSSPFANRLNRRIYSAGLLWYTTVSVTPISKSWFPTPDALCIPVMSRTLNFWPVLHCMLPKHMMYWAFLVQCQDMVRTRVGFVLSDNVTMQNINYQGIDTIRPSDNGALCGGGAFETKGCAENDCTKSSVNNGGSETRLDRDARWWVMGSERFEM